MEKEIKARMHATTIAPERLCIKKHRITVLSNQGGFYIGTLDEDHCPHCRISQSYYPSRNEAQRHLDEVTFKVRSCIENDFCSGGARCF